MPGPQALSWLWGGELQVHESAPGVLYVRWEQQYGDVVQSKGYVSHCNTPRFVRETCWPSPTMVAVTHILGDVFDFPKSQGVRGGFRLLVDEGLLAVEGEMP